MSVPMVEIEAAWTLLATPTGTDLAARELPDIKVAAGAVLLALGAGDARHVLIPVKSTTEVREDRRSAGVQLVTHLLLDGPGVKHFIDVTCPRPHLHEVFSLLVAEMLAAVEAAPERPDIACHRVLDRWRELLDRPPSAVPDDDTVCGVLGELLHLRALVRRTPAALARWLGPMGARHDFEAPGLHLEVKTTRSRGPLVVEIHGLDQLETPPEGELALAVLRLEQAADGGHTITSLVDELLERGVEAGLLHTLLARAGIGPDRIGPASERAWRVSEEHLWWVDGSFPRLTRSSLVGGTLPPSIVSVRYRLDLSAGVPEPLSLAEVERLHDRVAAGA